LTVGAPALDEARAIEPPVIASAAWRSAAIWKAVPLLGMTVGHDADIIVKTALIRMRLSGLASVRQSQR
jgi:hypothetical protein